MDRILKSHYTMRWGPALPVRAALSKAVTQFPWLRVVFGAFVFCLVAVVVAVITGLFEAFLLNKKSGFEEGCVVALFILAPGVGWLMSVVRPLRHHQAAGETRMVCIDGLRGYLALGVVIHHFSIWFRLAALGWVLPPEPILANIGNGAVCLFFMITGALFYRKMVEGTFSAASFFVGRFFRIVPLYAALVVCLTLAAFYRQGWSLKVPLVSLGESEMIWLLFQASRQSTVRMWAS